MSGTRSESTNQSPEQAFINALSHADDLVNQADVRLPFIFDAFKKALELYQKISVAGQSERLLAFYFECRSKFLRHSSALIVNLIKPAVASDTDRELMIKHAEIVLDLREKYLADCEASESRNQLLFREQISHFKHCKQDLEMVKVAGNWGYNCVNIPKDGNCLFSAFADQLKLNDLVMANPLHDEPHLALRSLAVKHLSENRESYAVHISNDTTLSSHTAGLACTGTWGDHLEIMAMVRELMITLVLIQEDKNILVFKAEHSKAIFYLGYETNYHYVSLHRKDNSPLHSELAAKIENAPIIESGPYILHAVLEVQKKISTASNSVSNQTVRPTPDKKPGSSLLAFFYKASSSTSPAEDKKNTQKKPNKLLALISKGSSSSMGPR